MKRFFFVLILLIPISSFSQINVHDYIPRVVDGPGRTPLKYKWPYFDHIPPFIGVVAGYEGFRSSFYEVGLAMNFLRDRHMYRGGMAGGQLIYKRHFRENTQSYEAEIGWYETIVIGVNANYHVNTDKSTFGVKPFIGFCIYNFQCTWGYNIYSDKQNEISSLKHSNFQLKYVIPIIPFKGKGKYYQSLDLDYRYGGGGYGRDGFVSIGTPSF